MYAVTIAELDTNQIGRPPHESHIYVVRTNSSVMQIFRVGMHLTNEFGFLLPPNSQ
jgi:hypothetical protein